MTICLKKARQTHDAYIEQRLRMNAKRIAEYENIIKHLVDVADKRAEPCEWIMRQARSAAARIR